MERESGSWRARERVLVKEREISVIVFNIPASLDQYGMAGIFQRAGKISDVYIPSHQRTKKEGRYGFVRFYWMEDAKRCIHMFNGGRIRGLKISVFMAKPKRQATRHRRHQHQRKPRNVKVRKEWRKKTEVRKEWTKKTELVHKKVAWQDQEERTMNNSINGTTNEDLEEWLERTLVCTTEEPRDLATLDSAMLAGFGQPYHLRMLSCVQYLVTFPTVAIMSEVLQNQGELMNWFIDIKKWGMEDRSTTRRVWLDVFGVPPHGWTWESFKAIAEIWGSLICLGKSTFNPDSFEVMRLLIATKVFKRIEDEVVLKVAYGGYRVTVREVATIYQVAMSVADTRCNAAHNQDVPGFEDIEDNMSNNEFEDEVRKSPAVQIFEDEVRKSPTVQIFSKGEVDKGPQGSYDNGQMNSSATKTKTVSFSQNGYSVEIMKVNQHLSALENRKVQEESQHDSDSLPPPRFESGKAKNNLTYDDQTEPAFEDIEGQLKVPETELSDQAYALGPQRSVGEHQSADTHPNTESLPHKLSYKKILLQSNSESSSSTPESLVNLAKESLQVGELLGVRVTGSVEAAISRITTPLKQLRKKSKKARHTARD